MIIIKLYRNLIPYIFLILALSTSVLAQSDIDDQCCYMVKQLEYENGFSLFNLTLYDERSTSWKFNVEVNLPSGYTWYGAQPYSAPFGTVSCNENSDITVKSTLYPDAYNYLTCNSKDASFFNAVLNVEGVTNSSVIENSVRVREKLSGGQFKECSKKSYCEPVFPDDGTSDGKISFGAFGRHPRWFIIVLVVVFGVIAAIVGFILWYYISSRHYDKGILGTEKSLAKRLKRRKSKTKDAAFPDDHSYVSEISNPRNINDFDKKPTNEYDYPTISGLTNGNETSRRNNDPFEGIEGRAGPAPFPTLKQMNSLKPQFQTGTLIHHVEVMNTGKTELTAGPGRGGYIVSPPTAAPLNDGRVLDKMAAGVAVDFTDSYFDDAETPILETPYLAQPNSRSHPHTISQPQTTTTSRPKATLIDQVIAGAINTQNMTNNRTAPSRKGTSNQSRNNQKYFDDDNVQLSSSRKPGGGTLIDPEALKSSNKNGERLKIDTTKLIGNAAVMQMNQRGPLSAGTYISQQTTSSPSSIYKRRDTQNQIATHNYRTRSRATSNATTPVNRYYEDDFGVSSAVRQSPTLIDEYYAMGADPQSRSGTVRYNGIGNNSTANQQRKTSVRYNQSSKYDDDDDNMNLAAALSRRK